MKCCETLADRFRVVRATIERRLKDAATRRALRAEFAGLSSRDLDRVLADIGLSRDEMEMVIHNAPRSQTLLDAMLQRLDLRRNSAPATLAIMRAVERRCATCGNHKDCADWLEKGAPGDAYRRFCPNAAAFDALSRVERAA